MALRQLPAAWARSAALICTRTSFSDSANVAGETAGPTGGAVPNAGGAPAVGSWIGWASLRDATAAPKIVRDASVKNCRRDLDIHFLRTQIIAGAQPHAVQMSFGGADFDFHRIVADFRKD